MKTFDYVRPATVREAVAAASRTGRRLSGRRHQPSGPDEGRHQPARTGWSTSATFPTLIASRTLPTAACGSARWSATPTSPTTMISPGAFRRSPRRCCPERPRSFGTPPRSAAICLQRTRCAYFYDVASACNKREPGSGCDARGGENRLHAIMGWSESCIATHPSDFCVPLVALDAVVDIEGSAGRREIPLEMFHRLPGDAPERESMLEPGEIIVAVRLPAEAAHFARHARYLKVRERTSYAFAVVSAAAALRVEDDNDRRSTPRARRRCHETLASPRSGIDPGRRAGRCLAFPSRRRGGAGRRQSPPATTASRSSSHDGSWCGHLRSPPPARPIACRRCRHPPSPPFPETSSMPDIALTQTRPLIVRHGSNIGQPLTRRDGILKVTGAARYAADHHPPGMLYAVLAVSSIARGRVTFLDVACRESPSGRR